MTESKFMSEPGTTRLIQQIKSMPDQLTIGYDESDGLHVIDGSITANKLANGAVTTDKIANGAVTSDKIAEGGITGDNIADGAITADKLAQDVISQLGSNNPITSISGTVIYPKSQNEAICNYPCVYNNELLLTFFAPLSSLKSVYFIENENDDEALSLIEAEIKTKLKKIDINEFNSYVDQVEESTKADAVHDQAIGELGVSTAALLESNSQLTASNADVLQAIGELGAMVAAMQVSPGTPSNVAGETA